ncbi:hypothetical protein V502_10684 [Pseudogymnoascus sp. VKM F-4520 (FW-2644)]|nr:hypothetical protein V502_10684 [Pseudogymnoascus sp. VKM F-4520 (FW-2644)]
MVPKDQGPSFFHRLVHRNGTNRHTPVSATSIHQAPQPAPTTPNTLTYRETAAGPSTIAPHDCNILPLSEPPIVVPERLEKYGLFCFSANYDNAALTSQSPDIIAIHGINGDAYRTWTDASTGKLWLRDFLPGQVPGARIFSFGYPSEVAFTKSKGDIKDFARSLLASLKAARVGERLQCRPLIFICHSMGGLVVKQALITARLDAVDYGFITGSTRGILFLSTPHRGSEATKWPELLSNVVNVATAVPSAFTGSCRTDLLRSLQKNSGELGNIATDFRNQMKGVKIVSFLEQNSTPPLKTRVVDNDTGTMNVPGEVIVPMNGCDHRDICRFSGVESNNYRLVLSEIKELSAGKLSSLTKDEQGKGVIILIKRIFNGILWLKGKPGSGKSTIMKHAIERAHRRQPCICTIVLSFYFNARGSPMDRSPLGLFRSLLHQLLWQARPFPDGFLSTFREKVSTRRDWTWTLGELQALFLQNLKHFGKRIIIIFIDALDECDEDDARDIMDLLQRASSTAIGRGSELLICVSSRHYPSIRLARSLELWMEDHNNADIRKFVKRRLSNMIVDDSGKLSKRNLEEILIDRASGVFLWVFLVMKTLSAARQKGASLAKLKELLLEIPDDLHKLFEQLLVNITDAGERDDTLHLLQCVLCAERPLLTSEIRHALAFCGNDTHLSIRTWTDSGDFLDEGIQFEYLLVNRSRGLVEILGDSPSISDSFARATLRMDDMPESSLLGKGQPTSSSPGTSSTNTGVRKFPTENPSESPVRKVQLIHESVRDFLLKKGQSGFQILSGTLNDSYVGHCHLRLLGACISYIATSEILSVSKTEFKRAKLFSEFPFLSYALDYLVTHAQKADKEDMAPCTLPQRPWQTNIETFQTWIRLQDQPGTKHDHYFQRLIPVPDETSANVSLLYMLCQYGILGSVKAMVQAGVDINIPVGRCGPALVAACRGGQVEVASYLLSQEAYVNSSDVDSYTALHYAAAIGNQPLSRLLLSRGADIDQLSKAGTTALYEACLKGQEDNTCFLISQGASVKASSNPPRNILTGAIIGGTQSIINEVLANNPDIDREDSLYGIPLHACSSTSTFTSLLKKGADLWSGSQGLSGLGSEKIWAAVESMSNDEFGMLKHINKRDSVHGKTLLHWAVAKESRLIVESLLSYGARSDIQDRDRSTPLHYAAKSGSLEMAYSLVLSGSANALDVKDRDGRIPLRVALAYHSKMSSIVKFLGQLCGGSTPEWVTNVYEKAIVQDKADKKVLAMSENRWNDTPSIFSPGSHEKEGLALRKYWTRKRLNLDDSEGDD